MEGFKVKVGDFDVIESGSVITMIDSDIHFFVKGLEFVFIFTKTDGNEPRIKAVSNNGRKLVIELQNFDNSLGTGNVNPIPMGRINGNDLFIMFRVTKLDKGGRTMHYSWLSKPAVVNTESHE